MIKLSELKTATRDELIADAPIGHYLMSDEERRVERLYDINKDEFREGPTSCIGRVLPPVNGHDLPACVDFASVRYDGLWVIVDRVLDDTCE